MKLIDDLHVSQIHLYLYDHDFCDYPKNMTVNVTENGFEEDDLMADPEFLSDILKEWITHVFNEGKSAMFQRQYIA